MYCPHPTQKLDKVKTHRMLYRDRRKETPVPVVSLVGYTNAGKSSLLNALTAADVYAEDQLFATLDPTTRRFPLPNGHRARSRVDGATAEVFYDLKTTREKRPLETFWRAVQDFHYDIQAAVYRIAAEAIGYEPHSMRFICTSTVWPYLCEVAYLPDALVDRAHDKVLRLADELAARKDMDHWLPDSYGQVHELWVPARMLED